MITNYIRSSSLSFSGEKGANGDKEIGPQKLLTKVGISPLAFLVPRYSKVVDVGVELSHVADDYADTPDVLSDKDKEEIFEFLSKNVISAASFLNYDTLREFNDYIFARVANRREEIEKYKDYDILEVTSYLRERIVEDGQGINRIAFELALLQFMVAGFVQTAETEEDESKFLEIYYMIISAQTGESIEELREYNTEEIISRSSGSQLMFYCLAEKLHNWDMVKLIANYDALLGPLVYLENAAKEQKNLRFFKKAKDKWEKEDNYILLIDRAVQRIQEFPLEGLSNTLLSCMKYLQTKLAIRYILNHLDNHELRRLPLLRGKYRRLVI